MRTNDQTRPSSRRGASGAWRRGDRLKPAPATDTLEMYGHPSKGETRLNDFRTQEIYFNKIIERYMRLCAINEKQLTTLFASISISPSNPSTSTLSLLSPTSNLVVAAQPLPNPFASPSITELSTVLAALRKLREAITATARKDAFARRAYFFGIHAAVLCKDWESYAPALNSLLNVIHRQSPLNPPDVKEYVGLLILDQACRLGDIALAHETRLRYAYRDRRVEMVLRALVADNWVVFWKMKRAVDGYQRSVMEFAEQGMRVHALKCLGRGYMSADRKFVERSADRAWAELVKDGVGWELTDADKVVIKKPKAK
ncbi:hypothetical protein K458DRAFT_295727 [Lentithecium fluviatile CBS 122367]|uniref:CSN8/PSMD8/EIF3K domain-containing protein n=1 Tax=Lentithecium fluviatile CBS 122367 TaxID=1168545 RepID=A0A6G1JAI3_9PLEO|nr:hypothetical protein K458DRAFT_295727 [Lentithecium fluviatile CBS 122367]